MDTSERPVSWEVAIAKANELLKEYEEYYKTQQDWEVLSFGNWVMTTHYPSINPRMNDNLLSMCSTSRTSDARTYLIANISSGRLPI